MVVDGRGIADAVYAEIATGVQELGRAPRLAIVTCAPDFATEKYLGLKRAKAEQVGIETEIVGRFAESTTEDMVRTITECVERADGVIAQLPFPAHIDTEKVLAAIPATHDVDALGPGTPVVHSPVVGACAEILARHKVTITGKHAVVVGNGRLVGRPARAWLEDSGATVTQIEKDTPDAAEILRRAEIIVCGAGDPHFLTPDMITDGVVILDAGTSEAGGMLRGDANPACADKAALFTPVPGGVGPVTVAVLLRNLLVLARGHAREV